MAKVYCKKCKHLGSKPIGDYNTDYKTPACMHSECFQGELIARDTPMLREEIDNRVRVLDMNLLNATNNCSHFGQKKSIFDFFKKNDTIEEEDDVTRVDTLYKVIYQDHQNQRLWQSQQQTEQIKLAQTENDLLKKEISKKEKIIEKQNNIIFNRISKNMPSKKNKNFIRHIDLD